jgi:hypothetical protein
MRVIFLDFDGVLHDPHAVGESSRGTVQTVRALWPRTFVHASLLAQVLADAPDVRIIVTSSWRLAYSDDELRRLVPELARWFGGSIERGPRDQMIRAWVHAHDVTAFMVLDGEPQAFVRDEWPQLVDCNPVLGFAEPRVVEAVMRWLSASALGARARPGVPRATGL